MHAFAASADKGQRFLYVVDGSNKAIRVMDRQTLEIVSSIGGHAGHNAREFFHAHSIASDSKVMLSEWLFIRNHFYIVSLHFDSVISG